MTVTPIRPDPTAVLALDPATRDDLRAFVDAVKPLGWRDHLMRAAEGAAAAGHDASTFGFAAEFSFIAAAAHTEPPTEPPELLARPPAEQIAWRLFQGRWRRHHLSPTIRDVQKACNYKSTAPALHVLKNLVKVGLLEHLDGGVSHAYRLPARWR